MDFCHLHCHTQFSLLDGAANIDAMMAKAKADGQKGVAITDHGNMFGAFKFFVSAQKHDLTPIIGCEVYVVKDRFIREFKGGKKDKRYHQLLLAKNAIGYKNLSKICSIGFIDGYYRTFPRVDKEVIKKYSEGLIASTCCIGSEVQQTIIHEGEEAGERVFKEWLDIFGEDYYVELQRHNIKDIDGLGISQEDINQLLIKWSKKYKVKTIATNDSHYVDESDAEAHDILLCLQTGNDIETPNRFKFPNNEFFFKTKAEMGRIFSDVPEALDNTMEIYSKIEPMQLKRDILLPNFGMPPEFKTESDYLRHLTYIGAKKHYPNMTPDIKERIDRELGIIDTMGFSGYFLITQDLIIAAKKLGVAVGPGRGSAAGSVVAFCTAITNIDPIKYNLLFERFLNPERVSMPDIDTDFDDEGRQKVIDYVIDKYGKNQVAQIITYGTMAARSSIRDVGRVLKLPLSDTDRIAKLIPEKPGTKLVDAFREEQQLRAIRDNTGSLESKTLAMASILEGSVRHRGIHAAGVIIAPNDITEYIPVCTSKDTDLLVTQFDGKLIEDAGMLKMDFLGLKTLTIIKDAVENIHLRFTNEEIEAKTPNIINPENKNRIDPDLLSLEDELSYEIFQRGETVAIFQFESPGMQKYLKDLKPTNIEDLIAMNALYRPGPMDNIPEFVDRKHGRSKVTYPHEWLAEILKPTYGIMVYQEQIMQAAQIMAGYSLGGADILRRAMGKKKASEMVKQREVFRKGAIEKGVDEDQAMEIFDTMEKFAAYGFNRSHSAAYSVLAFQTAFLKAHYPAEFMASVLTHNMNDIKKINFFLNECNRLGIKTLTPDVNESMGKFTVNKKGDIRFGLNAVKGVGGAAVDAMILGRKTKGAFTSLCDMTKKVNLRAVNKKSMESLAMAGAFDGFGEFHRSQYIMADPTDGLTGIEKAVKFGQAVQREKENAQASLFGAEVMDNFKEPDFPAVEPFTTSIKLKYERDVTGIFLSDHPLNTYKREITLFATADLERLDDFKEQKVRMVAMVSSYDEKTNKSGSLYARITIEDYNSSYQFFLSRDDYHKHHTYFKPGMTVFITANYQRMKWREEEEYELKILDVKWVEQLREQINQMTISLAVEDVTPELVQELEKLCISSPGNLNINMHIRQNGTTIPLFSRKHTLKYDPEILNHLEQMEGVNFSLKIKN